MLTRGQRNRRGVEAEVENEDPEQMATLQPEQQVEEQRAEITVDEFTDDIEQAGTSRIPSCDIITLDGEYLLRNL